MKTLLQNSGGEDFIEEGSYVEKVKPSRTILAIHEGPQPGQTFITFISIL